MSPSILYRAAGLLVATVVPALAAQAPPLALSHSWIVVTTGAPERKALERAGFRIAPTVNRHEGQGTASVTIEFLNGFLELIYPDSTVPVSPGLQPGAEKFRLRSAWEMPKAVSLSISSHHSSARESENAALARDPVKGAVFLLDVTLDNGKQGVTKDLEPELPVVIHY